MSCNCSLWSQRYRMMVTVTSLWGRLVLAQCTVCFKNSCFYHISDQTSMRKVNTHFIWRFLLRWDKLMGNDVYENLLTLGKILECAVYKTKCGVWNAVCIIALQCRLWPTFARMNFQRTGHEWTRLNSYRQRSSPKTSKLYVRLHSFTVLRLLSLLDTTCSVVRCLVYSDVFYIST